MWDGTGPATSVGLIAHLAVYAFTGPVGVAKLATTFVQTCDNFCATLRQLSCNLATTFSKLASLAGHQIDAGASLTAPVASLAVVNNEHFLNGREVNVLGCSK